MTRKEAREQLEDAGATRETKEDSYGDTQSGWWQDTCYLSADPVEAWSLLNGN